MPGIITHHIILKESIAYLQKKKKKNYLLRSIQSLFNDRERLTASLFGAIGPNVFDAIPSRPKDLTYGHKISFQLHNGLSRSSIDSMYRHIFSHDDRNTEWVSLQRAYLYGYISHLIADSMINPYILYFSGFPDTSKKNEIAYYRDQFFLYQYYIDLYFLNYREDTSKYRFTLQEMLPIKIHHKMKRLYPPVKALILESFYRDHRDIYNAITYYGSKPDDQNSMNWDSHFGLLDLLPYLLPAFYKMKTAANVTLRDWLMKLRKKNIFSSDLFVLYPQVKGIDFHIINHYRERWQYPVGSTAIHYESIENIMQLTCDRIVEVWEKIENSLFDNNLADLSPLVVANAYTGVDTHEFNQMKQKNHIRLKY